MPSRRLRPSRKRARPRRRSRAIGTRNGRAGDVVEPHAVEELDRARIAAVLAADPDLQLRLRLAAAPGRQRRRARRRRPGRGWRTDPPGGSPSRCTRGGRRRRRRASSRRSSASGRWSRRRRSRPSRAISVRPQRRARDLDHRADLVGDRWRVSAMTLRATSSTIIFSRSNSRLRADERDHDLRVRLDAPERTTPPRPRRSRGPASRRSPGA